MAPLLARELSRRLVDSLGGVEAIEAFGKAAIVGTSGEIEHGAALIHTPYFGNLMREFLDGESIICFADTRADAGETLVVPLWHKTAGRDPQSLPDHHRPRLRRSSRRRDRRRRRRLDRAASALAHRGPAYDPRFGRRPVTSRSHRHPAHER